MLADVANIAKILLSVRDLLKSPPGRTDSWKDSHVIFEVQPSDLQTALDHHLGWASTWSSSIPLVDVSHHKDLDTDKIFVHPSLMRWKGNDERAAREVFSLRDLVATGKHRLVLGYPGAGKTTLLKHVCQQLLTTSSADKSDAIAFPVVIEVRQLAQGESLYDFLRRILGFHIAISRQLDDTERQFANNLIRQAFLFYLDSLNAALLIDGVDEVPPDRRALLVQEISRLTSSLRHSSIIITARTGTISQIIANTDYLFIEPFDTARVGTFVRSYFANSSTASSFLDAVYSQPYADSVKTPLHLGNLCLLYSEYGELPPQPIQVYRRVINLRLERWDRLRGITRPSKYARFEPEQKRLFLGRMSFEIAKRVGSFARVSHAALVEAYQAVCMTFDLPPDHCTQVVDEIESHTGVLVSAGFEQWEFAHKSLQEFLTAEQIVGHPNKRSIDESLLRLPDECAIATGICSDPAEMFTMVVADLWRPSLWKDDNQRNQVVFAGFWRPYLRRLILERVFFAPTPRMILCLLTTLQYHTIWNQTNPAGKIVPVDDFATLAKGLAGLGNFAPAMAELSRSITKKHNVSKGVDVPPGVPKIKGIYKMWISPELHSRIPGIHSDLEVPAWLLELMKSA